MKTHELVIRVLIAIVIGHIILVLGTTFAQEIIVDGVNWYSSSKLELIVGGLGSFLAAILSGGVVYIIVKKNSSIPLMVLSILVLIETIWLIQSGRSEEPIWFSLFGGAILILGFWVGKFATVKLQKAKN